MDDLVTLRQAAKIIGINRESVRYAVQKGLLPVQLIRIQKMMVKRSDAKAYKPDPKQQRNGKLGGRRSVELRT